MGASGARRRLVAAAWLLMVPSCGAAELRIGLIAPLSGGSSDFGKSVLNGANLAVREINQVGGYLGSRLVLVVRDDKGEPATGRAAAEDLVQRQKVAYTIGYCNTGVALKALDVFESARHLLMVPCSQGSAVTRATPPQKSFVFRMAPADHMNAALLVREIVDRRRLLRVAILADTTGYGQGGVNDITAELARRGLAPAAVIRYAPGIGTLTAEMEHLRSAKVDALVNYAVGPEQAVAVRSRAELGWKIPYFAPWPLSLGGVLSSAGAAALEGTMMTQSIIQDAANERRSAFVTRYLRESSERPVGSLMAAAQAYDAVHLMLRAVFQTRGDVSGAALKQALESLQEPYRGVITTYDRPFSPTDHEAFSEQMIWLGVWRQGSIRYNDAGDARLSAMVRRKREQP